MCVRPTVYVFEQWVFYTPRPESLACGVPGTALHFTNVKKKLPKETGPMSITRAIAIDSKSRRWKRNCTGFPAALIRVSFCFTWVLLNCCYATRLVGICDPSAAPKCFGFGRPIFRGRHVIPYFAISLVRLSHGKLSRQIGSMPNLSAMELHFLVSLVCPMLPSLVTAFW